MSEKYCARELAFHYLNLTSQNKKLSEQDYLLKLVNTEIRFAELLAVANPPAPNQVKKTMPEESEWV